MNYFQTHKVSKPRFNSRYCSDRKSKLEAHLLTPYYSKHPSFLPYHQSLTSGDLGRNAKGVDHQEKLMICFASVFLPKWMISPSEPKAKLTFYVSVIPGESCQ